jgi:hypothetical protein
MSQTEAMARLGCADRRSSSPLLMLWTAPPPGT